MAVKNAMNVYLVAGGQSNGGDRSRHDRDEPVVAGHPVRTLRPPWPAGVGAALPARTPGPSQGPPQQGPEGRGESSSVRHFLRLSPRGNCLSCDARGRRGSLNTGL